MKLVQTECMTWFALIWFIGGYGWKKIKQVFLFVLHSVCTLLTRS